MTLPANIRVNIGAPFPSLVKGSGPITISKVNGIWTIGFNFSALGVQSPPSANYPTDFIVVYDSLADTFFKMALSSLVLGGAPTQRYVTTTPTILGTDQILNVNISPPTTITLPGYISRSGVPLTFKNLPGSPAQTIAAAGGETIDGQATVVLGVGATMTLLPFNDGVNTGWSIV